MKYHDLTQIIKEDMPVYPGTKPPTLIPVTTLDHDGFAETMMTLYSHTGTHLDAPAHMAVDGLTLDQMPVDHFIGSAICIDVRNVGQYIMLEHIIPHQEEIAEADFVLLCTGWSAHWDSDRYYHGYPVLEEAAANWLAANNLKGVGVDAISVDPSDGNEFANHGVLFGACLLIIENLKNLENIIGKRTMLMCLPINYEAADGAPVRAVAIEGCNM